MGSLFCKTADGASMRLFCTKGQDAIVYCEECLIRGFSRTVAGMRRKGTLR